MTDKEREKLEIIELERELEEVKEEEFSRTKRLREQSDVLIKKRKYMETEYSQFEEKEKRMN